MLFSNFLNIFFIEAFIVNSELKLKIKTEI